MNPMPENQPTEPLEPMNNNPSGKSRIKVKIFWTLVVLAVLAFWGYISTPVARINFSKDRRCKLVFHELLTGNCVLSYYENNVCLGTVKLHSDFLNNPMAFFPGPSGECIVCLSYLDTTYAAFTVDLSKQSLKVGDIPPELRQPGQEAVDSSDFEVRACTRKEVDFVVKYIKSVDIRTLSNLVRGGLTEEEREALLKSLIWATTSSNWRDPLLKYAKPQILPEN
jgi:hypothetical protein